MTCRPEAAGCALPQPLPFSDPAVRAGPQHIPQSNGRGGARWLRGYRTRRGRLRERALRQLRRRHTNRSGRCAARPRPEGATATCWRWPGVVGAVRTALPRPARTSSRPTRSTRPRATGADCHLEHLVYELGGGARLAPHMRAAEEAKTPDKAGRRSALSLTPAMLSISPDVQRSASATTSFENCASPAAKSGSGTHRRWRRHADGQDDLRRAGHGRAGASRKVSARRAAAMMISGTITRQHDFVGQTAERRYRAKVSARGSAARFGTVARSA